MRHFGRVFDYLYKSVLMVDRALKDAGSDPPGPSASASSSNGTRVRDLNMQLFMRPLFATASLGALVLRGRCSILVREGVHETHETTPVDSEPPPAPGLYHGKGGHDAASSSMKEAIEAGRTLTFSDGCPFF